MVFEAIRQEAVEEPAHGNTALFWSGLAAGLSMGFSFIAEGLLQSAPPEAPWLPTSGPADSADAALGDFRGLADRADGPAAAVGRDGAGGCDHHDHLTAGPTLVAYALISGATSPGNALAGFFLPTLIGNILDDRSP